MGAEEEASGVYSKVNELDNRRLEMSYIHR